MQDTGCRIQDKSVPRKHPKNVSLIKLSPFGACGDVGRAHDFQKKVCVEICVICGYNKGDETKKWKW